MVVVARCTRSQDSRVDSGATACEMMETMANNERDRQATLTDPHCVGEQMIPTPASQPAIMHALRKWCLGALLAAVMASPALGLTVTGRVFVDQNGDGVAGATEPGLGRVVVSDGKAVVLTSKSGDYQLETEPGRLVFVTLPRGYRAAKSFYFSAQAGQPADFALVEWPESRRGAVRFVQITDIHIAREGGDGHHVQRGHRGD